VGNPARHYLETRKRRLKMSKMPECRRCGDYVYHGPCLCEQCSADYDEFVKLRARAEAAERKLDAVRHTFIVEKDGSITEYHGELLLKEK